VEKKEVFESLRPGILGLITNK